MRLRTAILLLFVCTVSSANASVRVLVSGFAHDCYLAAQRGLGDGFSDDTCTTALADDALSPRDRAATYINRGVVRTNWHRYDAALADFEQAVASGAHLSPSDLGVAYVDRATVLNQMRRYREALDSVNKGLELGAGRPEFAFYVRAISEEELGDLKAAYYDYKHAETLVPGFTPAAEQLKRFRIGSKPANGS